MYHNIQPKPSIITIPPETFTEQIEWLYQQGYKALGLSFLIDHIHNGKKIPENSIFLTFDDGYAGLHEYVFPTLLRYGFSSTIFLVSKYCGQNNEWPGQLSNIPRMPLLNWDQIQEMDGQGIEFGSHTASHPKLDELNADEIKEEIRSSKELIEVKLGHKINLFAYPYGRYNQNVKEIVKSEFLGACSTSIGLADSYSDPYEIERIDINLINKLWVFRGLKSIAFPYYLAGRKSLRKVSNVMLNRSWR